MEIREMGKISISEILDDLRVAGEVLRKFERRYWVTSEQFYELYNQGLLDNGEHGEDFSEWAGFCKLKERREEAFKRLSQMRLGRIKKSESKGEISLEPQEMELDVV